MARLRRRARATSAVVGGRLPLSGKGSSCPGCDVAPTSVPAPAAGELPTRVFAGERRSLASSATIRGRARSRSRGCRWRTNLTAARGKHPLDRDAPGLLLWPDAVVSKATSSSPDNSVRSSMCATWLECVENCTHRDPQAARDACFEGDSQGFVSPS